MAKKRPSACTIKAELQRPGSGGSGADYVVDFSLDPHALASEDKNRLREAAARAGYRKAKGSQSSLSTPLLYFQYLSRKKCAGLGSTKARRPKKRRK